jgi:hypothetical protein
VRSGTRLGSISGFGTVAQLPRLYTLKTHHVLSGFALSMLLASSAQATESLVAAPELSAKQAAAAVPLVLGAPPAWMIMALGVAVISITVLRRRKAVAERARR